MGTHVRVLRSRNQFDLFDSGESLRKPRPFLKWAGGKTHLLPILRNCSPPSFNRYFEPFLGGAALFFDLSPAQALLSDSNPDLIQCFTIVRERPDELLECLATFRVSEQEFYRIRAMPPDTLSEVFRAARFIYLNKTCYNGVYRVNKKGEFNTPFGHYKTVSLVDAANLKAASRALQSVTLVCEDYRRAITKARRGDFLYLDPPYLPVGKYSDFKRYTREFFYESDHRELAFFFRRLSEMGCQVLLSNSYHNKIVSLYSGFSQATVEVPRFVNCKGESRGKVKELLIANYPLRIAK